MTVPLRKGVLKICSNFTGEHLWLSVVSRIALRHGCSPVNLLHIFRIPLLKNTSGWLLLNIPSRELNLIEDPNEVNKNVHYDMD